MNPELVQVKEEIDSAILQLAQGLSYCAAQAQRINQAMVKAEALLESGAHVAVPPL